MSSFLESLLDYLLLSSILLESFVKGSRPKLLASLLILSAPSESFVTGSRPNVVLFSGLMLISSAPSFVLFLHESTCSTEFPRHGFPGQVVVATTGALVAEFTPAVLIS